MLIQKDLDDLKADVHKVQVAFRAEPPATLLEGMPVLFQELKGSVIIFITRGSLDEIIDHMRAFNPAILDVLPLTLEEIFIYEMEDNNYEIKNILY